MRLKLPSVAAVAIAASTLVAGPANALLIDFTDDSVWGVGKIIAAPNFDNQLSTVSHDYAYGVSVTVAATGGNLTFNKPGRCGDATFLACDGDGIGITDDEVSFESSGEALLVTFSQAVGVYAITLLDLFGREADQEQAYVSFNGSSEKDTIDGVAGEDGVGLIQIAMADLSHDGTVTAILFTAPDPTSDYALAAIEIGFPPLTQTVTQLPEPLTVGLFGIGLLALALTAQPRAQRVALGRGRRPR